jgi:hypothetical protein
MLNKENQTQDVSLYDYLGRAAGSKLGKEVFNHYTQTRRKRVNVREVSTATYNGKICLYPKEYLDSIFINTTESISSLQNLIIQASL